eukprot:scaffold167697_cov23-Tisochrysis_lutea.AAC.3
MTGRVRGTRRPPQQQQIQAHTLLWGRPHRRGLAPLPHACLCLHPCCCEAPPADKGVGLQGLLRLGRRAEAGADKAFMPGV